MQNLDPAVGSLMPAMSTETTTLHLESREQGRDAAAELASQFHNGRQAADE
jgi:hypothetical protein